MDHPLYEKDKLIKIEAPKERSISHWPDETRFDLPFPDQNEQFLYCAKFWNNNWYTPAQFHDHFELCYVCEGHGWFILEGMIFPVEKGDIFITKPGEVHCGGAGANSGFLAYAVGFRFERMGEMEKGFYRLGIKRICRDELDAVGALFDRILAELEANQSYAHIMVQSYLLTALTMILRYYENQEVHTTQRSHLTAGIMEALSHIHSDRNYSGKVDELAKKISMSRVHLDREFKVQMGVSIGEYIRGVWVERAKQLLRQTEEPLSQIAEKMQMDSPQAFCMFFKRQTGLSPKQFRNRI
jgi:AraC family L-rhamnose operon regulatory protein RhaS